MMMSGVTFGFNEITNLIQLAKKPTDQNTEQIQTSKETTTQHLETETKADCKDDAWRLKETDEEFLHELCDNRSEMVSLDMPSSSVSTTPKQKTEQATIEFKPQKA